MSERSAAGSRRSLGLVLAWAGLLLAVSLSCSVGQAVVGRNNVSIPTATKTPRPTFTSLPGATAQAAQPGTIRGVLPPGVTVEAPAPGSSGPTGVGIATSALSLAPGGAVASSTPIVLYATVTPVPSATPTSTRPPGPTATPTPDSETNRPTQQVGPRALPTPYVVVEADTVNGRRGPAVTFEIIGEAAQGTELIILGRTANSDWWQVCCIANQPAWVTAGLVSAKGPLEKVPVFTPGPTPAPTTAPSPTATRSPTPTRLPPFDVARGPEFPMKRDDGRLTIWVKVYEGPTDNQKPLPGYVLKVFRDGVDVSSPDQSSAEFDEIAQFSGSTKTVLYLYNLKFEMYNANEADWQIYLTRADGSRVSPIKSFTTKGDSYRNLVVFIAYWLAR